MQKPALKIRLIEILILAALYFFTARLGQLLAIQPGNVTPVWIPSGIILAAVLLRGYYLWPGIFLGAFIGNVWAYIDFNNINNILNTLLSGTSNGIGDSLCALISAYLIRQSTNLPELFAKTTNIVKFIFYGALIGSAISALFGVTGLAAAGFINWNDYSNVWLTWWVGDAVGIIFITPLIMTLRNWPNCQPPLLTKPLELSLFLAILLLMLVIILNILHITKSYEFHLLLLIPLLIWSVVRFNSCITFFSVFLIAAISITATSQGYGPFAQNNINHGLIELQAFLFIISATIYLLLANKKERQKIEQALLESQHYNRVLFEKLPLGLALCDMQGNLVDINQEYANILGREIEETKQLSYWDITPEKYASQEQEQLATLEQKGSYGPYEKEYLHKDGRSIPVRLQGTLLKIDGKDHIWSSVEDIQEVKRQQQRLEQAKLEADKANEAKSIFLSSMSHELRTPLNAVLGFAQLLQLDGQHLSKNEKNNVNEILKAGNHLLKLINEILDLSRIESGKMEINNTTINICEVLRDVISTIEPVAQAKQIKLVHHAKPTILAIADSTRLKQALLNLVSNAIKYSHDAGEISIRVEDSDKDKVRIEVIDTGSGIAENDLETIFIPFERLPSTNIVEGTGIGLTLSKQMVELMNGTIGVHSIENQGSTFWIELPAAKPAAQ